MKISISNILITIGFLFLANSCKTSSSTSASNQSEVFDEARPQKETVDQLEQEQEAAATNYLQYRDHVYKENIGTPQLFVKGDQMTYPVIFLGSGRQLELHFDDLSSEFQVYNYKYIHCNANWEPSGLTEQEYLSGFLNGFIEEYEYSFNTLFSYINYSLIFPNQETQFTLSGNYLLLVYANNDEEDLVLSKRFYVVDEKVSIKSSIKMATLARFRDYKQEIDFTLNHEGYNIQDPYADLKVVISQNRRWDNAIDDLKPLFVKTPELVYNYEDDNLFDGNNEYRFFDTKDLRYQSMNVDGIQIMDKKTHVYLLPEEPRSFKRYFFQQDLNGRRLIKRDESRDANREADYMLAHFTLKRAAKVPGGDVYVFGELSDWEFKDAFKMDYVEVNNEYVTTAKLKQGYYNYNYVFLPHGKNKGDMSVIEGTHAETENDYYFFVYHRQNGEIYDRLVGFDIKNSNANSGN
ncbi:MAG: DUF5103 domain-containing protein [Vicingaceae bacterium]